MNRIFLAVAFTLALSAPAFAQNSMRLEAAANFHITGLTDTSSFVARGSLFSIIPTGASFPATCSSNVPPGTTEYCGIRVRISFNTPPTFATLFYVSPEQIYIEIPFVQTGGGNPTGYNTITIEKQQSGSWVFERSKQFYFRDLAPLAFVTYRFSETYQTVLPFLNAIVYVTDDGINYYALRNVVDTPAGDPTPVPRIYNGYTVIVALYLSGGRANINNVGLQVDGTFMNGIVSGRSASTGFLGLEQMNFNLNTLSAGWHDVGLHPSLSVEWPYDYPAFIILE